jgi:hypothetical protein
MLYRQKHESLLSETGVHFDGGMCCVETYVKLSGKPFFRTMELNIIIDNPDIVTEMVSAVIGDEPIKHFAD